MSLSMMESKLPPGFRFHPRDDELICDYLTPKIVSKSDHHHHHHLTTTINYNNNNNNNNTNLDGYPILIDVDLNKCEPWDLPEIACVGGKEWYFFNLRDRKYATGQRTNRATMSGYWKATGKDRQVVRKGVLMGMRKTLVFYQGRAPKGKKTDWVMHEFRLDGHASHDAHPSFSYKEDWVLCRVFYKSRGAAEMRSKPTSSESCYDDTGSSSVPPPLTDNFIAFDQSFNQSNFTAPTSLEQVPCFSNYPQLTTTTTATTHRYIPLADMNKSFSKDLASSCFNPMSLPQSRDQKIIKSVLDHFSKLDSKRDGDVLPSSESYLSENGLSSSMWYPFQN